MSVIMQALRQPRKRGFALVSVAVRRVRPGLRRGWALQTQFRELYV